MPKLKPYTRAITRSVFAVLVWNGKVLVGKDALGKYALPGGKMERRHKRNTLATLFDEIGQELGKAFRFRRVQAAPLIFCTGLQNHAEEPNPLKAGGVDLRFFYLAEPLNHAFIDNHPKEISGFAYVDIDELLAQEDGVTIRHAVAHALHVFNSTGVLRNPPRPQDEPELDVETMHEQLRGFGFSPPFARDYSYGRKKAKQRKPVKVAKPAKAQPEDERERTLQLA
ncbi:MAG: hypothetical protein EON60_06185 [Alphaproteobacteria bacterium]|nr:MAG: hypothetical protein EON60_06185 [Alphaproteobacteria bacterium]